MKTSDFEYVLPKELIAQRPAERRDESRMLVLNRAGGTTAHRQFSDFPVLLNEDDLLVLNDTRVIPARLIGKRSSGARVELFLLHPAENGLWRCLVQPGRKVRPGDTVLFGDVLKAEIVERNDDGSRDVRFIYEGDFEEVLNQVGHVPLPPYIQRDDVKEDRERYQTVYAHRPGAVAAPTAGLHFTPEMLDQLAGKGVDVRMVTLHVGLGTFKPVTAEEVTDHRMESEWYEISSEVAEAVNSAKSEGRRIIAVGTTCVRTLESAWNQEKGELTPGTAWTDIFIYPGYRFKVVDALLTNFHLPCSTLIMLVSALAGREKILSAYQEAVEEKYRFYSYGDCMFIC
jgi:S-adenosylmethionine:tRNA ribosyltransferase-isomerase